MLLGSINHVSVTVSDLEAGMRFFRPVLEFLGFTVGETIRNESSGTRLTVNINYGNGLAFNVWEAKPELADHRFEVYEPGLHHIAFNAASRDQPQGIRLHQPLVSLRAQLAVLLAANNLR